MTVFSKLMQVERWIFEEAWGPETCYGKWDESRPSRGQCAVTALVLQDKYGGVILNGKVGGVSHFWNHFDGYGDVDLTRDQFDVFNLDEDSVVLRTRESLLHSSNTYARYMILKANRRLAFVKLI